MPIYKNTAGEPAVTGDLTMGGELQANGTVKDIKKEVGLLSSESILPSIRKNQLKLAGVISARATEGVRIAKVQPEPKKENVGQPGLTAEEISSFGGNFNDFAFDENSKTFNPSSPDLLKKINETKLMQQEAENVLLSIQRMQRTPETIPLIDSLTNLVQERINLMK